MDSYDDGYAYQPASPYDYYGNPGYSYPSGSGSPSVVIISNGAPGAWAAAPPQVVEQPPPPQPRVVTPPQSRQNEQPLYLLAFHDGIIRAVLAYWVDGTTVHYVTMDHEQKQTPLSSLDRSLSERLNQERAVTFSLPAPAR